MQFSDTSNKTGLIQDCEFLTNLGDTAISGDTSLLKDFTRNINIWYHKTVTMILQSQDEWDFDDVNHADYPILTTDLVADQQDYTIPASEKVLKIKRVEAKLDGTNWNKAEPFDINESGLATDTTTIANNFSKNKPFYDLHANALFLYPIPDANVTGGLKIWWTREVDEFTTADTTQEPGIDEPFHRLLSIGASLDYAMVKGKTELIPGLQGMIQEYELRLKQFYSDKQKDRQIILKSSFINYN